MFVLAPVWVKIERGRIRHVATRVVRNDGDVIAYLVLIRIAFERIKRIAHGNVRRPCDAAIGAKRIE